MPKWAALGSIDTAGAADVDPDTIDNIYDEADLGVPPKGVYLSNLKRLQGTESKAGDPMLKMVLEFAEPKGSKKAKFNGYSIWNYQISTKERASGVNGLLHALLDGKTPAQRKKIIDQYWAKNVIVDEDGFIKKIGTWNVPESIMVGVNTAEENSSEYGQRLHVAWNGIMPASDRPASKATPEPEDDDEPETDDEPAEDVDAREEELSGLGLAELRKLAKGLGVTGKGKDGLIEAILDAEFADDEPEDEDEDEDEEEEADEPEGDEFDEMDRAVLKKYNTAEGLGIKVTTKMSDDDLRDAIRAALPDDEEEEEEDEEDEPEPAPARGRARATAAAPTRAAAKRRQGAGDEPPF